jgi:Tfp pilus assembly protein PilF
MENKVKQYLSSDKLKTGAGLILLALLLTGIAGCAIKKEQLPEPTAGKPAADPAVAAGAGSSQLEDGRLGFEIREVPNRPADWQADFSAAVERLNEQDYPGAIELLQKVIEHEPGVTAPYIDIALAYRKIDQPEPAEENLKKALELVPGHPVASNEYGLLLRKAGRFAEARTVYEQALTRYPDYLPVHRNLGILCDLYLNDLECANDQYERYSIGTPDDEQVKIWLADLRLRLGR